MRPHPRPLEGDGAARRIAPFALAGALAFALLPLLPGSVDTGTVLLALALAPPLLLTAFALPWPDLPPTAQALPPLAYFVIVALLRDAQGEGLVSLTPLVILPVVWFALHGTRVELGIAVAGLAITLLAPMLIARSQEGELGRAVVWVLVSGAVGYTVQTILAQGREQLARVSQLALTDPLTGLPNRRAWEEELPRAIARAARWQSAVCVAILDLDRFKAFNDARGHPRGDLLLKEATAAWRTCLREVDFLARYGGEEFAVILPDCDLDHAVEVIDRVRTATPHGQTTSSGIACWDGSEAADDLLLRADIALYEAKNAGRDQTSRAA